MRLKLGMIGGGEGAFIGGVHRMAARLDDRWTLVAGAFSSDAGRSRAFGQGLGLADDRCYGDWRAMAKAEAARPDGGARRGGFKSTGGGRCWRASGWPTEGCP